MHVSELETPALVIDLDSMERNLARAADYTRAHGLRLRPHTKTHKTPEIARRQLCLGAAGLAVAKVGEAEVMLGAEPPDLLVAYPVIGPSKLRRLMKVARKARVTVALDSLVSARQLSDAAAEAQVTVGVLAEVDVGLGRVGVSPGRELLTLAQNLLRLPRLTLEGIAFYPGHIRAMDEEGKGQLDQLRNTLQGILEDFRRAGIELKIVSGGSTPALYYSHLVPGMNEVRPGTYLFNDLNTAFCGACSLDDCAASILVTVVSTARPGQMIVDGGSKTFSSDRLIGSQEVTFGRVAEAPGCVFHRMNEEHGYIDVCNSEVSFSVGDRVHIIPNHICAAVNLHEHLYGLRGDRVEQVWDVAGRGKLQ